MKSRNMITILSIITLLFASCRETVTEREVVREVEVEEVEERETEAEPVEENEGILERTAKEVDQEVNKEIDEEIEKIGDDN